MSPYRRNDLLASLKASAEADSEMQTTATRPHLLRKRNIPKIGDRFVDEIVGGI
jgi:hypothetical protein